MVAVGRVRDDEVNRVVGKVGKAGLEVAAPDLKRGASRGRAAAEAEELGEAREAAGEGPLAGGEARARGGELGGGEAPGQDCGAVDLSLIPIFEPTRLRRISYAVF